MQQVNLRLIILGVVVVVLGLGGVFALHEWQVFRNADSLLTLARERVDEGRGDEAIAIYARYIGLRPVDGPAHAEYARLLLRKAESSRANRGTMTQAYDALEAAVRKNPEDEDLRQKLGNFLLRTRNFSDARQHFAAIREARQLGKSPRDAGAENAKASDEPDHVVELRYAMACAGMGRYDEAMTVASKLIGFDPGTKAFDPAWEPLSDCSEAYILIAEILERRYKDLDTSSRVMRRLPEAYPKDYKAWLSMARWSFVHNDLGAAGIEIAKAADLAPETPEVLFTDFEIAMRAGNYARAERVIRESMAPFSSDPRVVIGRADLALARNEANVALDTLTEGLATIDDNPLILERVIDLLFDLERGDEVEPHLDRLREIQGDDDPAVMWAEARLKMASGQWHQGIEFLRQLRPNVAQSDTLTHNVDLALAICHQNLGQSDELMEAALRVLSDDPNSYQARIALATAHSQAGRVDEALAEFESLAGVQSPEELASKQLLWAPLLDLRLKDQTRRRPEERDWSKVDELVDMLAQSPVVSDSQLASVRSSVLQRKGEAPAAIEVVTKARDASPDSPMVIAQLVTLLLANHRVDEARQTIENASPSVRKESIVLSAEARVAASEGDEKAEAGLAAVEEKAKELPTKDAVNVLLAMISVRMGQGRLDEAERLAKSILEREPGELRTHSALLDLAAAQNDVGKLEEYARMIGDVAGRASPQAKVAQAMVHVLQVRLAREQHSGADAVLPPLTAEDKRHLEEARNFLMEAENDRPGWFQIQQVFAQLAGMRGDTEGSITHLQRAILQGSTNPEVPKMLAALLRQTGRLEEARDVINSMGEAGGLASERITVDLDAQAGRFDAAVARAEKITSESEPNADNLLWFGQLLAKCRRDDRAIEVFTKATEVSPERLECWLELIRQQLRVGLSRPAEESLARAKEHLPDAEREIVEAATYEMTGRPEQAEKAYRAATAAAPTDHRVARRFADFLVRRGQLGEARDELLRIVAMPEAAGTTSVYWARRMLARHTSAGANWKELMEICRVLEQNTDAEGRLTPEDVRVEFAILMDREEPEAWRRAIALIDDLARREKLDLEQRVLRAWLQDKLGDWIEARKTLVDIAAEESCPPHVIATLVEQLIAHGELVSARTWAARLRARAPDAPMTLRSDAKLAVAAEDREAAAEAARKLIPNGPVTPENAVRLGLVAELVEELQFPKAADRLLVDYAAATPAGIVARAKFLGRQLQTEEALGLVERAWGEVPDLQLLDAAIDIVRSNGTAPSRASDDRLIALVERARRTDPDSTMLELLDAVARELLGQPSEAEKIYRGILAKPSLPATMASRTANNLASLLIERGEFDEARSLIDRALEELGPHPTLLDTRGMLWLGLGDTTKAIEDLKESSLAPTASKHLHMAVACFAARQVAECRAALAAAEAKGIRKERLSLAEKGRLETLDKALADHVGN